MLWEIHVVVAWWTTVGDCFRKIHEIRKVRENKCEAADPTECATRKVMLPSCQRRRRSGSMSIVNHWSLKFVTPWFGQSKNKRLAATRYMTATTRIAFILFRCTGQRIRLIAPRKCGNSLWLYLCAPFRVVLTAPHVSVQIVFSHFVWKLKETLPELKGVTRLVSVRTS